MIDLKYPKDKDMTFENRLCILLTRNNIKFDWTPNGMSVNVIDLNRANDLINWLLVNNRPV